MNVQDFFHDRRSDLAPERPEPESGPVEQDPENAHCTESAPRMSTEAIIDSLRFPSANPGEGMIQMRRRDQDLCRHCQMPILSHGTGFEHHVAEPMAHGKRTPGISADVEDGRARSTQLSGVRPTHRRDID